MTDPTDILRTQLDTPEKMRKRLGQLIEMVRPSVRPGAKAVVYIMSLSGRLGHIVQEPWILRTLLGNRYDQLILVTSPRRLFANSTMYDILSENFTIVEASSPVINAMGFLCGGLVTLADFDLYMASPEMAYRDFAAGVASGLTPRPHTITASIAEQTSRFLEEAGADIGRPRVILHVRDEAYLPQFGYHSFRFADVARYRGAVDRLIEEGYVVCRLGDADSPALDLGSPNYVEVMRHVERSAAIDIGVIASARFAVASPSGPYATMQTFGRPSLVVNVVPQQDYFHVPGERFVFKPIIEAETDRTLRFSEVLSSNAVFFTTQSEFEQAGLRVGQNTAEELLDGVVEMIVADRGDMTAMSAAEANPVQARFRQLCAEFHESIVGKPPWQGSFQDCFALSGPGCSISEGYVARNPGYLE